MEIKPAALLSLHLHWISFIWPTKENSKFTNWLEPKAVYSLKKS